MANTQLFVNVGATDITQSLVRSVTDMSVVPFPQIVLGDNRTFELYFVDGLGNYASFSGNGAYIPYVGIGTAGPPTGGTFTVSFDGYTTGALAWNISPAALQTALQALTSIGSGNILVTGLAGQYYVLTFTGALGGVTQNPVTVNAASLTPISTATIFTLVSGGSGVNNQQLVQLQLNPLVLDATWSVITNGWSGILSGSALSLLESLATGGSPLAETLQVSLADGIGNRTTYLQSPCSVVQTIIDPNSFAGNYVVQLATLAQLNAAILGQNNFTYVSLASAGAGNTNILPAASSRHTTTVFAVTGTAALRTLCAQTTNSPIAGDVILIRLTTDTNAGNVINIYNATTSGTLLSTITTDGSGRTDFLILVFNGSAWQLESSTQGLLSQIQNLYGLMNIRIAKSNIGDLFANLSVQSSNFAVSSTPTQEGYIFLVSSASGAVVATIPTASTAGANFLLGILKTDSTAQPVTTSPATESLTAQGQFMLLMSDGTTWHVLLNTLPPAGVGSTFPVVTYPNISSLVGGGSTQLDGIATANGATPLNQVAEFVFASQTKLVYRLRSGTDASASMWIVRPADYNASTNAVVWELLSVHRQGWPCTWNNTQGVWNQIVAIGAAGYDQLALGAGFTFA